MGRSRKPRIIEQVTMTGTADKGKAVGRHEGKVIFVDGAVPGDVVDVLIQKKKKGSLSLNIRKKEGIVNQGVRQARGAFLYFNII